MTLKGEGKGPLPPLLTQYLELIEQHPDYLVLFQVGDFYECFGEHAEQLARLLGLVLTHKTSNTFTTPMAGIPVRSADGHIETLLKLGVRVAVADQVEPATEAEGLVRREVTQLITPGTVTAERILKPDANYLAAVATGDGYGVAFLDITTGEFRGTQLHTRSALYDELERYRPAEVLLAPELYEQEGFREAFGQHFPVMLSRGRFDSDAAQQALREQLGESFEVETDGLLRAAGAVLAYASHTQQGPLHQVTRFQRYDPGAFMQLDEVTLRTLEIFAPRIAGGHTLFEVLGDTRTAPGRRLLRAWLRHPLLDAAPVRHRLDAVEALVSDGVLRRDVRRLLHRIYDLERLASRLATGQASARDLAALARSAALVPLLCERLAGRPEAALARLLRSAGALECVQELIRAALTDDPPPRLTEGGLLRDGFDAELDSLRHAAEEGRSWIAALEEEVRSSTGIPTLKIGFNGVFGYYFEVTRLYYDRVPPDFRPVQTLKDRQRYTRSDLREKEREVLLAEQAAQRREYAVFNRLRKDLAGYAGAVREVAGALAELDAYATLAELAARQHYCRPRFRDGGELSLKAGRHPVVELHRPFVPNDAEFGPKRRLIVLTGPNMSGKSTYLRQVALIALLAQVGSFVPAESAELPIFDRIYTRIGASDDIAGGRSTFMVEMGELARILTGATPNSLVLLDEVGRGTSTYDGLALAWAASEQLHDHLRCTTLFATHYFELTQLAGRLSGARNLHVAANESDGGLTFYHQVLPGPASKAYGLEVARLAGVPAPVLDRARQLFATFDARREADIKGVLEALLERDLSLLSPLEALQWLHELQAKAHGLAPQG